MRAVQRSDEKRAVQRKGWGKAAGGWVQYTSRSVRVPTLRMFPLPPSTVTSPSVASQNQGNVYVGARDQMLSFRSITEAIR